jgi:hypothetical protein
MGATKVMPDSVFGSDSALPEPGPMESKAPAAESFGRNALSQPQCTICLEGAKTVEWFGGGTTGSFHVDTISNNRASYTSGSLDLKMILTAALPVWGQTITYKSFSDSYALSPLWSGDHYSPVDSGTVLFHGSSIPAGEYFLLMYLREYVDGTMYYADWSVMDKKLLCDGTTCHNVTPAGCTEDAYTMCLANGRYRVTSHWRNQFAGGATANLNKAKLTDFTGAFWIQDSSTYEYMIRLQTGQSNGGTWIAIPTFTNVEFWVAVTDTVNGQYKEYHSAPGNMLLIYDPYYFIFP